MKNGVAEDVASEVNDFILHSFQPIIAQICNLECTAILELIERWEEGFFQVFSEAIFLINKLAWLSTPKKIVFTQKKSIGKQ